MDIKTESFKDRKEGGGWEANDYKVATLKGHGGRVRIRIKEGYVLIQTTNNGQWVRVSLSEWREANEFIESVQDALI